MTRTAACRCGAVTATCAGEPTRVSACHCYACQQRSGSAFAVQAWFPKAQVVTGGETRVWRQTTDAGNCTEFHFCPACGSSVFYENPHMADHWGVPVGGFADRSFPPPTMSVWEERRHPWVKLTGAIEHHN